MAKHKRLLTASPPAAGAAGGYVAWCARAHRAWCARGMVCACTAFSLDSDQVRCQLIHPHQCDHCPDPRQLLEVFTQLEEDNLFLIQNCQVGVMHVHGYPIDIHPTCKGAGQAHAGCAWCCARARWFGAPGRASCQFGRLNPRPPGSRGAAGGGARPPLVGAGAHGVRGRRGAGADSQAGGARRGGARAGGAAAGAGCAGGRGVGAGGRGLAARRIRPDKEALKR